ncbi:expressed unknown protein [Seminavis robusta]|uniref:Uncharacterized protein n=1 Tax=Seminavis robusta TaxID=568900 RepID=A0A9N8DUK1_9STRA|nr:expressed unknown protein [Seminavis robusta]|eukprot:Sro368_g128010.1 n/a (388) ;mRNA; f:47376-48539
MRPNRDPPVGDNIKRKKSICDYSGSSLFDSQADMKYGDIKIANSNYDKYTSMEEDDTELDSKLAEAARQCLLEYKKREEIEKQLGLSFSDNDASSHELGHNLSLDTKRPSFGEEKAQINKDELQTDVDDDDGDDEKEDNLTNSSVSSFEEEENTTSDQYTNVGGKQMSSEQERVSDQNMMILHETAGDDAEPADPLPPLPGFWITLFEFLTCAIVNICATTSTKTDITGTLEYEIPLHSVQDIDDNIGDWGNADTEQESLKPTRIAKAINFSSKRLDEPNAGIALYDEVKLRQEVHTVEIPDEYFDFDDEANDICEELSYVQPRGVPEAVVVKPKKMDDVSVLEDNSVDDTVTEARSIHAWSLSPRRKRRLKAKARASVHKESAAKS